MTGPFWAERAELAGDYTSREEWLTLRRTGIGSSDCSAILGLGKYGSPWTVWLDKTGRGPADPGPSEAMQWGTLLEPVIRAEFARRTGLTVVESPTLRSTARPWQMYSPDGLIASARALVEIKNASAWLASDWDEQVPDHAELQIQHGCAVTGADGAYVVGLIGGNRLTWQYVPRDDDLIATINDAEQHLWERYILADVEPPIDGSDATAEAIAARWPRRAGVEVVADDEVEVVDHIYAYQRAHAAVKAAEAQKAEAVNNLSRLLEGADAVTTSEGERLVAIKRGIFRERAFRDEHPDADWLHKVEVVDRDRLKAEQPDLYRRFQATSIYIPKSRKGTR